MEELNGRGTNFLAAYYRWKEWRSDTCAMSTLISLGHRYSGQMHKNVPVCMKHSSCVGLSLAFHHNT